MPHPNDTDKHKFRYLVWDGRYSYNGNCTAGVLLGGAPVRGVKARKVSLGKTGNSVRLWKGIYVRIEEVDNPILTAFQQTSSILIRLTRAEKVRSLMLRVYRRKAVVDNALLPYAQLVYQEILDRDQIDQLPFADPTKIGGIKQPNPNAVADAQTYGFGNGLHRFDAPYHVVVWVGREENTFQAFRNAGNPDHPLATAAVKDPTAVKGRKARDDGNNQPNGGIIGLLNFNFPPVPDVRVIMYAPRTGTNNDVTRVGFPSSSFTHFSDRIAAVQGADTVANRCAFIDTKIQAALANGVIAGDNPANVLQVFIMPEWAWRQRTGLPYTAAEKGLIVATMANYHTLNYPALLLHLGTIYWCQPFASVHYAPAHHVFNSGVVIYTDAGGQQIREFKKTIEADIWSAYRPVPVPALREMWGRRAELGLQELCQLEAWKNPVNNPPAHLLTAADQAEMGDAQHPRLCQVRGLSFGFDICGEHDSAILREAYRRQYPAGLGVDVQITVSAGTRTDTKRGAPRESGYQLGCDGQADTSSLVNSYFNFRYEKRSPIFYEDANSLPQMRSPAAITPAFHTMSATNLPRTIIGPPGVAEDRIVFFNSPLDMQNRAPNT